MIVKYQLLAGRKAKYVPGWDCHGLPIELKVIASLTLRHFSAAYLAADALLSGMKCVSNTSARPLWCSTHHTSQLATRLKRHHASPQHAARFFTLLMHSFSVRRCSRA